MQTLEKAEAKKYFLHFVGHGIYEDKFEKEAQKLGVQRAVPFSLLKSFHYGESVLLANFFKPSSAEVFGYFSISGISNNLPKPITQKLLKVLDVVKIDKTKTPIQRVCGSYTIRCVVFVNETIQSLIDKISKVCEESDINPNDYKWFLTGPYSPFENPFLFSPTKFTRGYMRVEVEGLNLPSNPPEHPNVIFIYDYTQKRYLSQKERRMMNYRKLSEYL